MVSLREKNDKAVIRTVLFDWGDTVMRSFPEYSGPMAYWPRVEAVPGIAEALAALRPRYRLVLATNAADSGRELVQAALARAGLAGSFGAVFTARELGVPKPEPAFYRTVPRELDCPAREAAMVGDDYLSMIILTIGELIMAPTSTARPPVWRRRMCAAAIWASTA